MEKLHEAFCDDAGKPNLQQIIALVTALPEAIKSVPVDQLAKLVPVLNKVLESAGAGSVTPQADPQADPQKLFSDAVAKQSKEFADAAVKAHGAVIEKARRFVDSDYDFTDKDTATIMRDALATETTDTFTDAELPVAFKMLKSAAASYKNFADGDVSSAIDKLKDQEI